MQQVYCNFKLMHVQHIHSVYSENAGHTRRYRYIRKTTRKNAEHVPKAKEEYGNNRKKQQEILANLVKLLKIVN